MKTLLKECSDVLTLNITTLAISFTDIEMLLKIVTMFPCICKRLYSTIFFVFYGIKITMQTQQRKKIEIDGFHRKAGRFQQVDIPIDLVSVGGDDVGLKFSFLSLRSPVR